MNAEEHFRLRFQALVARGLAAPAVAARVGLAGASEVWGGLQPRERPAWYLWLRERPGAWQIQLDSAETLAVVDEAAVLGRFTIRHYPSSEDPLLERFSPEERRYATEALDATGTPRIELAGEIPDALFTVGTLDWALDPGRDDAVVALASLDLLRTRTGNDDVARDVPGWRLGAPMFSMVAGLFAQVERRTATRLVVSRQPGFEAVVSDRGVEHRDALDLVQGEALLLFSRTPAPAGGGSRLVEAVRDPAAELVTDAAFVAGEHPPHEIAPDPRLALHVSGAWFGGEEHVEQIACAC